VACSDSEFNSGTVNPDTYLLGRGLNHREDLILVLTNSVALVRERTIPTERPPLVGEISVNFCG
jgi:hypothetical protein